MVLLGFCDSVIYSTLSVQSVGVIVTVCVKSSFAAS